MEKSLKELLLKDLCARLPYDVKGKVYAEVSKGDYDMNGEMIFYDAPFDVVLDSINTDTEEIHVTAIGNEDTINFIEEQQEMADPYTIEEFKPYLRSMSSMTNEEKAELKAITDEFGDNWLKVATPEERWKCTFLNSSNEIDWLNAHHFDYCGLIEKGLALEAPMECIT